MVDIFCTTISLYIGLYIFKKCTFHFLLNVAVQRIGYCHRKPSVCHLSVCRLSVCINGGIFPWDSTILLNNGLYFRWAVVTPFYPQFPPKLAHPYAFAKADWVCTYVVELAVMPITVIRSNYNYMRTQRENWCTWSSYRHNSVPMNKYGTCLEQLMRKFDPLKQLWDLLEVGVSHFVHGVNPMTPWQIQPGRLL